MADKQAKLLAALKKRPSEHAPPPPLAPAEPGASDAKVYHRTMEPASCAALASAAPSVAYRSGIPLSSSTGVSESASSGRRSKSPSVRGGGSVFRDARQRAGRRKPSLRSL